MGTVSTTYIYIKDNGTKGGALRFKYRCNSPVYFQFLAIFVVKTKLFEVLMKLKKKGHTICDPYQIFKKIFSLTLIAVDYFSEDQQWLGVLNTK